MFQKLITNQDVFVRFSVHEDNSVMRVRAMKPIRAGEELTIQYKGPMLGNAARNRKFLEHWKFQCDCPRCQDPTEVGTFLSAVR